MKIKTQDGDSSFEEVDGKEDDDDDVIEIKFNLTASMQEKPDPSQKKMLDSQDEIMMVEEKSAEEKPLAEKPSTIEQKSSLIEEEKKPENKQPYNKQLPCPLSEKAMAKLVQWKEFTKYGKVIEGTNIIACKTFLAKTRWTSNLAQEDQWTIPLFVNQMAAEGKKIGAIVDINNSDNYYSWDITYKKNKSLLSKVEYRKVKVLHNEIPRKKDMDKVYDVLNRHAFKDHYVLVHCTYGVNRTGYAICYYMCKKFGLKAREAIKRFEEARGYPFKYKELIQDLMTNFDEWVMRESIVPTA